MLRRAFLLATTSLLGAERAQAWFPHGSPGTESITLSTPNAQLAGATVAISGAYFVAPPASVDYNLNSAGWAAAGATISGGTIAFNITAPAVNASNTLQIRDHVNTAITSNTVTFASTETIAVTTPGAGQIAGNSYSYSGTYAGGPPLALDFRFDAAGYASASATISGGVSGTWSFTANAPSAGSHTLSVRDTNHTSVVGVSGSFSTSAATVVSNIRNATAWSAHTFTLGSIGTVSVGERCTNASKVYEITTAGTSTAAPTGTGTSINNGGAAIFKYSSGVDFTTVGAWVTANQGALTAPIAGYVWNDLPGTAISGAISITGITSSPTAGVTLAAASGESFADHPELPLGIPTPAYGVCFTQSAGYTPTIYSNIGNLMITRIQTLNSGGGSQSNGIKIVTGGTATVSRCNIRDNGEHDSGPLGPTGTGANGLTLIAENNVFPWGGVWGTLARGIICGHLNSASRIINNTFVKPANYVKVGGTSEPDFLLGGSYNANNLTIRNNAFFNAGYAIGFPFNGPTQIDGVPDGHNATDNANLGDAGTSVTVGNLTGVTFSTATFVQPNATLGLDLRLAAGSPLIGAGSTVGMPSYNIFGVTRSNPPNIGAV